MKWVQFVLAGAGLRGLPVLAAVVCHLRHGIGARLGTAELLKSQFVESLDTQLCSASLQLKCL